MKKNDSKYFYTASLMNAALLYLLEKKDIEFITVTEITKRAGVNRSTFYLHYDNIDDLLKETLENLNRRFIGSFGLKLSVTIESRRDAYLITDEFLIPYLNFCKEHKRLFKLIQRKPHLFNAEKVYKSMYEKIFYPAISQFVKEENERIYTLEFFTQGVVGMIHKWIDMDCKTDIDELVALIKKCIGYESGE